MKKSITILFVIVCVLLVSTAFVGEMTQAELQKITVHHSSEKSQQTMTQQVQIELLSYDKSFFTANMKMQVTIPIENESPLQLLVESNIHHYPYKATTESHVTFLDGDLAQKVESFFNTKEWLSAREEISLFGNVTGEMKVVNGAYKDNDESFNSNPLTLIYQYNLSDESGEFGLDWAGFDGQASGVVFELQRIEVQSAFSTINNIGLRDYQYQMDVEKISIEQELNDLIIQGLWLKGHSETAHSQTTMSSRNHLKIKEYQQNNQVFRDTDVNLLLSGLNLQAMEVIKSGNQEVAVIQQALSDLLGQGVNIHLQTLRSTTPWGEVDAAFNIDIEPGAVLGEVVNYPLVLIDYINGEIDLSLPQQLSLQPDVGSFLQMGVMSGLLIEEEDKLTLQTSLDRGELILNGKIIEM
ncbi:YdgA family protein [Psychromonas sp.]|nr:YdgA family protein [Psychromonas sp.]